MTGFAGLLSTLTAALVGWMAYRGSGHWWTGLAAGGTMWALLTIGSMAAAAIFATGFIGIDYQSLSPPEIATAALVANGIVLGWILWTRIRR